MALQGAGLALTRETTVTRSSAMVEPPTGEPVTDWQPEGWCVLEYAAPDASQAVGAVFRLTGAAEPEYRVKFRGLSRACTYRVCMENTGETFTATGRELVETGILVRLNSPMTSELATAIRHEAKSTIEDNDP